MLSVDKQIKPLKIFGKDNRDRCYDFFNIFAKKLAKKWRFFNLIKAKLCKKLIISLVFGKTPFFPLKIAENRRKLL
jgi:hypothetical protein